MNRRSFVAGAFLQPKDNKYTNTRDFACVSEPRASGEREEAYGEQCTARPNNWKLKRSCRVSPEGGYYKNATLLEQGSHKPVHKINFHAVLLPSSRAWILQPQIAYGHHNYSTIQCLDSRWQLDSVPGSPQNAFRRTWDFLSQGHYRCQCKGFWLLSSKIPGSGFMQPHLPGYVSGSWRPPHRPSPVTWASVPTGTGPAPRLLPIGTDSWRPDTWVSPGLLSPIRVGGTGAQYSLAKMHTAKNQHWALTNRGPC